MTQQLMAPSGGLNEIMQTIQQLSQMQAQQQQQAQQAQKFPLEMQQEQAQLDNYVQSGKQSKKASKIERKKGKKELQYMDTNEARAAESSKRDADRDAAALQGQFLENQGKALANSNTMTNQPVVNQMMQSNAKTQEFDKLTSMLQTLSSIPATPETNAAIEKLRAHINSIQQPQQ